MSLSQNEISLGSRLGVQLPRRCRSGLTYDRIQRVDSSLYIHQLYQKKEGFSECFLPSNGNVPNERSIQCLDIL